MHTLSCNLPPCDPKRHLHFSTLLPTLHQVIYPIVSLRELGLGARAYVEGLEDALIRTAGVYGISARVRISIHHSVLSWQPLMNCANLTAFTFAPCAIWSPIQALFRCKL